jgi:hypothetical protein
MKYHLKDPPREKYERIEKSPEDFYPHIEEVVPPSLSKVIDEEAAYFKSIAGVNEELLGSLDDNIPSKEKLYAMIQTQEFEIIELKNKIQEMEKANAKSKSKSFGKESKKVHSRTDKATVAHV